MQDVHFIVWFDDTAGTTQSLRKYKMSVFRKDIA